MVMVVPFAFCRQATLMAFHDFLGNGKPQTGAAHGTTSGFVYTIETLENTGQVFSGDAHTRIFDGNLVIFLVFCDEDTDFCLLQAVFDGVCHNVIDYLTHTISVAINNDRMFAGLKGQFLMFRLGMNLALANSSHEEFVHFDFRNIQAYLLVVKTGKL